MKKGVGALKAKNPKLALKYLEKALALDPANGLTSKYIQRAKKELH